jgi:hypothetical protein
MRSARPPAFDTLLLERIDHVHRRLYLDRIPIQKIGPVHPLPHSVEGRLLKLVRAGKDAQVFYTSIFANHGAEHDCSFYLLFLCLRRIYGDDLVQEVPSHHVSRDGELPGWF